MTEVVDGAARICWTFMTDLVRRCVARCAELLMSGCLVFCAVMLVCVCASSTECMGLAGY